MTRQHLNSYRQPAQATVFSTGSHIDTTSEHHSSANKSPQLTTLEASAAGTAYLPGGSQFERLRRVGYPSQTALDPKDLYQESGGGVAATDPTSGVSETAARLRRQFSSSHLGDESEGEIQMAIISEENSRSSSPRQTAGMQARTMEVHDPSMPPPPRPPSQHIQPTSLRRIPPWQSTQHRHAATNGPGQQG